MRHGHQPRRFPVHRSDPVEVTVGPGDEPGGAGRSEESFVRAEYLPGHARIRQHPAAAVTEHGKHHHAPQITGVSHHRCGAPLHSPRPQDFRRLTLELAGHLGQAAHQRATSPMARRTTAGTLRTATCWPTATRTMSWIYGTLSTL